MLIILLCGAGSCWPTVKSKKGRNRRLILHSLLYYTNAHAQILALPCFVAERAHGAVDSVVDNGAGYITSGAVLCQGKKG